ncbi:TPA: DUF1788 domain-containing protein [Clostridioides difficile]|nr:DUF1788 domain-containing protein [Clostridioides difficile]HBG8083913.1 DUF1788 domain-containing protein [Clostridioides difficile]HDQ2297284.1 DUF1788 domain-containing protein [Clostridioides difficile]HDQ2378746.1 DUF1788 domain-containing protein [Clostridioides difficile]
MSDILERLDKLKTRIQEEDFLKGNGLSNEVNIHIFCYDPADEMAVRYFTEQLVADQDLACHVIEKNLYRAFLEICDDKRITKGAASMEEKKGKEYLKDQILRFANNKAFVEKIKPEEQRDGDVLLITGVGEVFPFARVHARNFSYYYKVWYGCVTSS